MHLLKVNFDAPAGGEAQALVILETDRYVNQRSFCSFMKGREESTLDFIPQDLFAASDLFLSL